MGSVVEHRQRAHGGDLARLVLDPARTTTVVVVTVAGGRRRPFVDPQRLADELDAAADVHVLLTSAASWAFTAGVPDHTQVFGGASRTYPPGLAWTRDPGLAPLRYCFPEDDPRAVERLVVGDALAAASHRTSYDTTLAATRPAGGVVEQVLGEHRALVRLPDGSQALANTGLLGYAAPAVRLVREGQAVDGTVGGTGVLKDFRLARPSGDPGTRLREACPPGSLVLAQVDQVHETYATVRLHPDVASQLLVGAVVPGRRRGLRRFLTAGEVLLLRVASHDPDGTIQCSAVDVPDGATPTVDVAILPGGPAWLLPADAAGDGEDADDGAPEAAGAAGAGAPSPGDAAGDQVPASAAAQVPAPVPAPVPVSVPGDGDSAPGEADDRVPSGERATPDSPRPAGPRPSPLDLAGRRPTPAPAGGQAAGRVAEELRAVERERDELAHELHAARRRLESVENDLKALRPRLRTAVRDATTARELLGEIRALAAGEGLFDDPVEQFRHEVWLAWLRLVPDSQRAELPLGEYTLGPEFLDSLDATEGIDRGKVVEVVVEVLTGLAERKSARALHALGEGRASPQQVRHDGAKAWRCYLQAETASARRLHFWRLPGGAFELSRVVLHDDYRA